MGCELCNRDLPLEKHHVVPRLVWKRLKRRRKVRGKCPVVNLCSDCGKQVHMLFSERELASMTWEQLKKNPRVRKYVEWVRERDYAVGGHRESKHVKTEKY